MISLLRRVQHTHKSGMIEAWKLVSNWYCFIMFYVSSSIHRTTHHTHTHTNNILHIQFITLNPSLLLGSWMSGYNIIICSAYSNTSNNYSTIAAYSTAHIELNTIQIETEHDIHAWFTRRMKADININIWSVLLARQLAHHRKFLGKWNWATTENRFTQNGNATKQYQCNHKFRIKPMKMGANATCLWSRFCVGVAYTNLCWHYGGKWTRKSQR